MLTAPTTETVSHVTARLVSKVTVLFVTTSMNVQLELLALKVKPVLTMLVPTNAHTVLDSCKLKAVSTLILTNVKTQTAAHLTKTASTLKAPTTVSAVMDLNLANTVPALT